MQDFGGKSHRYPKDAGMGESERFLLMQQVFIIFWLIHPSSLMPKGSVEACQNEQFLTASLKTTRNISLIRQACHVYAASKTAHSNKIGTASPKRWGKRSKLFVGGQSKQHNLNNSNCTAQICSSKLHTGATSEIIWFKEILGGKKKEPHHPLDYVVK